MLFLRNFIITFVFVFLLYVALFYGFNHSLTFWYALLNPQLPNNFYVDMAMSLALMLSSVKLLEILFGSKGEGKTVAVVLTLVIAPIAYTKQRYMMIPLLPQDVSGVGANLSVLSRYLSGAHKLFLIGLVSILVVLSLKRVRDFIKYRTRTPKLSLWKNRVLRYDLLLMLPGLLLFFVIRYSDAANGWQAQYSSVYASNNGFYPKMIYLDRGPVLGFTLFSFIGGKEKIVHKPYSKETFEPLLEKYKLPTSRSPASATVGAEQTIQPDIVAVLVESMMDPSVIGKISYSRDPLKNFRNYVNNAQPNLLLVPTFGGNTILTEFDFLTGSSLFLFPSQPKSYLSHVTRPMRSMASRLRDTGYETWAVHNYYKGFWRRADVFSHLGFQHFIALEDMGKPQEYGKFFPDDSLAVDWTIKTLEQKSNQAKFIFTITVGLHGPYNYELSENKNLAQIQPIHVSGDIEDNPKRELSNYLTRLEKTDMELGRLYEYVRTRERPTILIVFGDHLPAPYSKPHSSIFDLTGFVDAAFLKEEKFFQRLYMTPYGVVSNIPHNPLPKRLGVNCLWPQVMMAFDLPSHFVHDEFMKKYCMARPIHNFESRAEDDEYRLMVHDFIFGEAYAE